VLDSIDNGRHSALVPPGALHHRVTAALANWQLDDAEELLADVGTDSSPYVAPAPRDGGRPADLGRAWADTLRAELLVRRLRRAGFTLVGDPVGPASGPGAAAGLDLHAGVADLIDGATGSEDGDPRASQARTSCSGPPAWPGTPASSCCRAASTPPWTRRWRRPACSTPRCRRPPCWWRR
jgi:hypothetical protein